MANELQLIVVTPETTIVDEPVSALRFPLFDGQAGVLPGRAPLVGRLGCGELKLSAASGERSYFVDGGFVQINGKTVTLLTSRCLASSEIDSDAARAELAEATTRPAANDADIDARFRDQDRARAMLSLKK
ncbi:MAG: F0F1 ATP synthase subunit epsilon [Planctomycetota bacterium]|nr:F0F1 ATP synthase subunit epsilon [Planctomycetota bacterium]MDA0918920.1 F0F1 ATP synthase subunit epsilon [Planctomycetota bacterium]